MTDITKLLEQLGNNFLKSALVPSLTFVIVAILMFDSNFNIATIFSNPTGIDQLVSFGLFVFIYTVILGFNLTALNKIILSIFEGKIIIRPMSFFYNKCRKLHLRTAYAWQLYRNKLERRIRLKEEAYLSSLKEETDLSAPQYKELEDLKDKYYQATSDYQLLYPENLEEILPTKLGNILKAAENYPGERYGFDGIHFWPRFLQFIPAENQSGMNNIQNELSFHLNMATLSIIFSTFCLLAIFYSIGNGIMEVKDPVIFNELLRATLKYLAASSLGFLSFGFFYNASVLAAGSFSMMIRSTSDLFRLELLKKLGLERPKDSIEEFCTWQQLNELIVFGSHSLTFTKMDYRKEE